MRPALLILIMDFLVASLFLYVSEPQLTKYRNSGIGQNPPDSFLRNAVEEFDNEQSELAERYYLEYAQMASDENSRALLEENDRIKEDLQAYALERDIARKDLHEQTKKLEHSNTLLQEAKEEVTNLKDIEQQLQASLATSVAQSAQSAEDLHAKDEELRKANETILELNALMRDKFDVANEKLDDVKGNIDALKNNVAVVNEKVDHVKGHVDIVKEKVDDVRGNIDVVKEKVDDVKGNIDDMKGKVDVVEKGMASILDGQEEFRNTLEILNKKVDDIPSNIQEGFKNLLDESEKRADINLLLQEALNNHSANISKQISEELKNEMAELNQKTSELSENLKKLENQNDHDELVNIQKDILSKMNEIASLQGNIDTKASKVLADNSSLPGSINEARVEINASLSEKGIIWDSNKSFTTFPVIVKTKNSSFALTHRSSVGLEWSGVSSSKLQKADYTIRFLGTTPTSSPLRTAQPISSQCRVIALHIAETPASLKLFSTFHVLESRYPLVKYLHRHNVKISYQKTDVPVAFSSSTHSLQLDYGYFSSNKPQKGDFIITEDGFLVGVMDDSKTCLVITEDIFEDFESTIDFISPKSLSATAESYKNSCPK